MRIILSFSLLLWAIPALIYAGDVKLAQRTPFAVPLADGSNGTALLIDAEQLLVAAPGNPPRLALFMIRPQNQPGPDPQPNPGPQPNPKPEPNPPPEPAGPLALLWIEESQARTPGHARALTDRTIREALASAGWSLRIVDQDVTDENGKTPPELAPAIAQAKQAGLPYLIAKNQAGAEIFSGKAPVDETAFAALLRKLGLNLQTEPASPTHGQSKSDPTQNQPKTGASDCPTGQCPTPSGATYQPRFFFFRRR